MKVSLDAIVFSLLNVITFLFPYMRVPFCYEMSNFVILVDIRTSICKKNIGVFESMCNESEYQVENKSFTYCCSFIIMK